MPRGHISTKWRCFLVLAAAAAPAGAGSLREPAHDSLILASLGRVYAMEYAAAESLLAGLPKASPARPYFLGLARVNRFADLGDTSALSAAEREWESLETGAWREEASPLRLYRGLAGLQLSYALSLRGSGLRSARRAWKARGELIPLDEFAEARAALALFDYYRSRFLEHLRFLPFVDPDSEQPLRRLVAAVDSSHYLRDLLRGSVFWIRYDRQEIDSALAISGAFLRRHPDNRLARQMQGDALFRGGRLDESRAVYEKLLVEYAGLGDSPERLPLGYFCAVGNLARIYGALGLPVKEKEKLAEWKKAEALGLMPWLPPSLKKEVAKLPPRKSQG